MDIRRFRFCRMLRLFPDIFEIEELLVLIFQLIISFASVPPRHVLPRRQRPRAPAGLPLRVRAHHAHRAARRYVPRLRRA